MDVKNNLYDVIVIGAGVHGCAAAHEIAKSGLRTLLLDQFPIPHGRGSSAGHSRIIRYAHYQCPELTKLMKDSFDDWITIQSITGIELFKPAKLLAFSDVDGNKLAKMELTSKDCGGNPVYKYAKDINAEYNLNLSMKTICLEDSSAGVLLADKCIFALLKLFKTYNGTITGNWDVTNIIRISDNLLKLEGTKGHFLCNKLIICAGPWTSQLLKPLGLDLPLTSIKVAVYYWKVLKGDGYFSFMHETNDGFMYGLPAIEYPGMMKLSWHDGIAVDPNHRDSVDVRRIKEKLLPYVQQHFPCLQPSPSIEESCMYTNTPDGDMILDGHPTYPNIIFACGFSGSGFKIAPAVAKILCKMALTPMMSDPSMNLDVFKMNRFAQNVPSSRL